MKISLSSPFAMITMITFFFFSKAAAAAGITVVPEKDQKADGLTRGLKKNKAPKSDIEKRCEKKKVKKEYKQLCAIKALYDGITNLDKASKLGGWFVGEGPYDPCAGWTGITCVNGNVTAIGLSGRGLTGTIAKELGNLSSLWYLGLDNNDLTGKIPKELGQLSNLKFLYLDFNALTGNIPTELGQLSNLQHLYLPNNDLTGKIPKELGKLSSLEVLALGDNNLIGTIPTELGKLSSLEVLYLDGNALTGTMPAQICARRDDAVPPGSLFLLWADCASEVTCDCCTVCF
jgi:hypothetical protein